MRKQRLWKPCEVVIKDEIKSRNTKKRQLDYEACSQNILDALEVNVDILEIMHEVKYEV